MIQIVNEQPILIEPHLRTIFEEQILMYFQELHPYVGERIALGAYEDERLVGGLTAYLEFESVHIELLAVESSYRGKGIGRQLVAALTEWSQARGVINLTVTTQSFQSEGFYERLSFSKLGEIVDMPRRGETKVYYYKRLV